MCGDTRLERYLCPKKNRTINLPASLWFYLNYLLLVTTQPLYEKSQKSIFLNGREGLAMHRGSQCLFLPRASFKTKKGSEV